MDDRLAHAREAFSRRQWSEVYRTLAGIPADPDRAGLDAADLERLAVAAYLVGRDDEGVAAWEAAHRRLLEQDRRADAARCSFWVALCLHLQGRTAEARGWLGRTHEIVGSPALDCPAAGYLLIPQILGELAGGDPTRARELAERATGIGDRLGDGDLRALGKLGSGQALVASGDVEAGTALFDEVMVSVTVDEVGPVVAGIVYCAVVLECVHLFDLARATEWTRALSRWCESQPDLVPYRGQCLVHRSQLQQAAGEWPDAVASAGEACQRLADPPHPALGLACYQAAEMHRLVGDLDRAEDDYRSASRNGYQPMPGMALLSMARGDLEGAAAAVRRALAETPAPLERAGLLATAAVIAHASGDAPASRAFAGELSGVAARYPSDVLAAMADQATGTALLGEGDAAGALPQLRAAATRWQQLRMPYEGARTAVLLGQACTELGDQASAALEFGRARDVFAGLGAGPDLARLRTLAGSVPGGDAGASGGLSAREREVLAQVAAGKSNRDIADALVISQHTVGRHLENIFAKLGVTSRTAATAYAYEHGLV